MNYKKLFFFLIAGMVNISLCVLSSNAMIPASAFNDPQQKEIFDFVSNLDPEQQEQLLNEIFEEVSKLPPEQQKEFWQEVEQEAVKLEEQMKQFEPVVTVPEQPVRDIPDTPKPTVPEPIVPAPTPVVEKKELPAQEVKKAEQLLESLIQELERLMRKMNLIPDIEAKVNRWIVQGNIKNSSVETRWSTLSYNIEEIKQKLYQLLERDLKTNKHKYLSSFVTHENLYNNLSHLERTLVEQGPQIEVSEFGSSPITEKSKTHIQQALSGIAESLYVLNVLADLSTVIGEYEPYAQKIKKEQEDLQQTARAQAGRPRASSPIVRAGQPPIEPRTDQKAVYRPFRPEYNPPHYSPASQPMSPSAKTDASAPEAGKKFSSDATTPSAGVSPEGKSSPSAKPEDKKKDDKKDKDKKDKDKSKDDKDELAKKYISSIEESLDEASALIASTQLSAIRSYLISNAPVNVRLATEIIPKVTALFEKASLKVKSLEARVKRIKDPALQKKYQEEINDVIKTYKSSLEKLSYDIKNIKRAQNISADKQYAYLDGVVQPTDLNLLVQIPTPASLYRLQEKIDEFFKNK